MKILFLKNGTIPDDLIHWMKKSDQVKITIRSDKISKKLALKYQPDFLISYNYRYIIKEEVLALLPNRAINLHIAYLPWNRGAHPNLWSFLENTPKGVTIHLIDKGLDTGDILLQKRVMFDASEETLNSSYLKLHRTIQELFKENWNKIRDFKIKPKPQIAKGSIHYVKDFDKIRPRIPENWDISIKELLIRCKSLLNANQNSR